MMNMNLAKACIAGFALLTAIPASAVELVVNGGFETGDFTGWTQFGGLNQTNVNVNDAVTGSFGARFSPNSPGGINQSFATVAGGNYVFSFDLAKFANPNLTPANLFRASVNGVDVVLFDNASGFTSTTVVVPLLASGTLTSIAFTFRDNLDSPNNRWSLDNVSFEGSGREVNPVPEPATWMMLLTGFALVGAASRRRVASAAA